MMDMIKATSDITECFFCMMSLTEDEVELGDVLSSLRVLFPSHKEKIPTDLGMVIAVLAIAIGIDRSEEGVGQLMKKTIGELRQFVGVAKLNEDVNIGDVVGKTFIGKKGAQA